MTETTETAKKKSQAQMLVKLAKAEIEELWVSHDSIPYATINMGDHLENILLESTEFKRWLNKQYWELHKNAPSERAIKSAADYLAALAMDGTTHRVYMRTARHNDAIYLDMGDSQWRAIEVKASGWKIISNPPVKFRRTKNTGQLPEPKHGGNLEDLRPLLATDDEGWIKFKAVLLDAMKGKGPYFVAVITGEQGSAKSTACKIIRMMEDPVKAALLSSLPRDEKDLAANGASEFSLAYDNVSYLPQWLSDCFCRVTTGAGFKARELYTNGDLYVCDLCAPVLLNGIPDFAESSDLLNRSLLICQPPVTNRLEEEEVWRMFHEVKASALGGLLNLLAQGLRDASEIYLPWVPRMADSTKWVVACMGNTLFLDVYKENEQVAIDMGIENSPTANLIQPLLEFTFKKDGSTEWTGTMAELLMALKNFAVSNGVSGKRFPTNGKMMGDQMRRDAPFLRTLGITYVEPTKKHHKRLACLKTARPSKSATYGDAGDAGDADIFSCVPPNGKPHI